MASASQSLISASSCAFHSHPFLKKLHYRRRTCGHNSSLLLVRASSSEDPDCNDEECAPDKEVGKVSMEWLAGEKTKVVGTFPPRKKGWTGYVEKDTAGQTNIYSVEPAVYVAESAFSSGSAGTSSDGAQNNLAIASGLALVSIAAASSILIQVNKNPPQIQTLEYSGPSLSYYINKFKPPEIVEASVPIEAQTPPVDAPSVSPIPAESQQVVALDPITSSSS